MKRNVFTCAFCLTHEFPVNMKKLVLIVVFILLASVGFGVVAGGEVPQLWFENVIPVRNASGYGFRFKAGASMTLVLKGAGSLTFRARGSYDGFFFNCYGANTYIRNSDNFNGHTYMFTDSGSRTVCWNTYSGDGSWVGGYWGEIMELEWNGVAIRHNGNNFNCVDILSSSVRENDPTILDVVYKVTSKKQTVKVRVLAFEDGERSFAKAVRPETFVPDTNGIATVNSVGDNVTPNMEHTISWRVSSDWQTKLAKVRFEVLSCEDELLPLEFMTIPASDQYGKMKISCNEIMGGQLIDSLYWLYAEKDSDLTLSAGMLKANGTAVAQDAGFDNDTQREAAASFIFGKMGYQRMTGAILNYANQETRLGLSPSGSRQYAYKMVP